MKTRHIVLAGIGAVALAAAAFLLWVFATLYSGGSPAVLPVGRLESEAVRALRRIPTMSNIQAKYRMIRVIERLTPPARDIPMARIEDRGIPGPAGAIPASVYVPQGDGPFGIILYIHGGGFIIGSIPLVDRISRTLARDNAFVVVSIEYRLAPEHPFPAAPDDCYAALLWTVAHARELNCDTSRLVVAGDSAGGNLAAVLCLMSRDRGGPRIAKQVLFYPAVDSHEPGSERRYPSLAENAEGFMLTAEGMREFGRMYSPDPASENNAYLHPMKAKSLSGLPPAFISTAEFDPLRDEGEAYAKRLAADGVSVELMRIPGVPHGYMSMLASASRKTFDAVQAFLAN